MYYQLKQGERRAQPLCQTHITAFKAEYFPHNPGSVVQIHSPQPCRRKLCIACDDFLCFPSKSRLALTPLPFPFTSDPLCWAPPRGGGRQISFLHAPAGNPCNLSVTGFFLLSVDHFLFGCIPPCGSDYAIWAGQPAYLRKSFLPPLQTRRRLL